MTRKHFLILLVLVLLIGGAGVFMFKRDTDQWKGPDSRLGQKVLPTLQVADISHIQIRHKKDELNLVNDGGTWVVKERENYPADPALIAELTFKARDWKVVQSEPISDAQRARIDVAEPDAKEGASTLLEFRGKDGKPLTTLYLGKKHLGKPPLQVKGFDKGQPDGRYLLVGSDPKTLMVVSDPMNNVEPKPEKWISKEFARVDRIKTLVADTALPGYSYRLSRETEPADWVLGGLKPNEKTDPSAAVTTANAFYSLTLVDIAEGKKADQLRNAITFTADTFDGLTYVMKVAPKPNDDANLYFTISVMGEVKKNERVAPKDEKPEEKEKRDKEHDEKFKRLEAQFAREKNMSKWVFVIEKKPVASLLRERARFIEQPEPPAPAKKK